MEASMRSLSGAILLVLLSSTAPAQQPSGPNGDAAPKGYTGAYAPPSTPPTPYSTGPLPQIDTGIGLSVVAADGSTKTVKAVPCSSFARETDGSTTCVGIPDESPKRGRR